MISRLREVVDITMASLIYMPFGKSRERGENMFFNLVKEDPNRRGIREVCKEALHVLRTGCRSDNTIQTDRVDGYFREILCILDEQDDDRK